MDKIIKVIADALKDLNEELGVPELETPTSETPIFGRAGYIDSLALVRLLVDVEGRVASEFGKNIVLGDERAVSQKRSPFRDVKSLAEYIDNLLKEN